VHTVGGALQFGALPSISSDITKHQHIEEVKDPFRRSNKVNPEEQMLLCRLRMHRCYGLKRHLEASGAPSLSALASVRQGRKVRSSSQWMLIGKWHHGEIELPQSIIGALSKLFIDVLRLSLTHSSHAEGKKLLVSEVARLCRLPNLIPTIATYLSNLLDSLTLTPSEHAKALATNILPHLPVSISNIITTFTEPHDLTDDPSSSPAFVKSII
jgi:hypothetical protein